MGRFLALILAILGGVAGTQAPGYTLQYMQNLNGQVDALRPTVEKFDEDVKRYGYTRTRALEECTAADGLLEALCDGYADVIRRFVNLKDHLDQLNGASDMMRPLVLARSYKREIVESARKAFKPAVPTTLDGAVYGGGAFVVFWLLLSLVFGGIGSLFGGGRRDQYGY